MIPELGHFALVLALGLGLIQSIVPVIGVHRRDGSLMRLAGSTALAQFISSLCRSLRSQPVTSRRIFLSRRSTRTHIQ